MYSSHCSARFQADKDPSQSCLLRVKLEHTEDFLPSFLEKLQQRLWERKKNYLIPPLPVMFFPKSKRGGGRDNIPVSLVLRREKQLEDESLGNGGKWREGKGLNSSPPTDRNSHLQLFVCCGLLQYQLELSAASIALLSPIDILKTTL